jgi:hypothetical protein
MVIYIPFIKQDPRYLSGELISYMIGRKKMFNNITKDIKFIDAELINQYLSLGWTFITKKKA